MGRGHRGPAPPREQPHATTTPGASGGTSTATGEVPGRIRTLLDTPIPYRTREEKEELATWAHRFPTAATAAGTPVPPAHIGAIIDTPPARRAFRQLQALSEWLNAEEAEGYISGTLRPPPPRPHRYPTIPVITEAEQLAARREREGRGGS